MLEPQTQTPSPYIEKVPTRIFKNCFCVCVCVQGVGVGGPGMGAAAAAADRAKIVPCKKRITDREGFASGLHAEWLSVRKA